MALLTGPTLAAIGSPASILATRSAGGASHGQSGRGNAVAHGEEGAPPHEEEGYGEADMEEGWGSGPNLWRTSLTTPRRAVAGVRAASQQRRFAPRAACRYPHHLLALGMARRGDDTVGTSSQLPRHRERESRR